MKFQFPPRSVFSSASTLYLLIFLMFTIFESSLGYCRCPSAISFEALRAPVAEVPAHELVAVSRIGNQWIQVPFDIISLEKQKDWNHVLRSKNFNVRYTEKTVGPRRLKRGDALIFGNFLGGDRVEFPTRQAGRIGPICKNASPMVYELFDSVMARNPGYFYLVHCPGGVSNNLNPGIDEYSPVTFDPQKFEVSGKRFLYAMSPKNQMLFDRLSILKNDGSKFQFASKGTFDIRADFKNFLTAHFTADSVRSSVKNFSIGNSSTMVKLGFGLSILFFDVDLDLRTDVLFTHDTVFLPMIMTLPRNAKKYVHPGSGVLYSWVPGDGVVLEMDSAKMPIRKKFSNDFNSSEKISEVVAANCSRNSTCSFEASLLFSEGGQPGYRLTMEILVSPNLVKRGFFPRLIQNVRREVKEAGWNIDDRDKSRDGIYFELAGLDAGEHGLDIWLRLDELTGKSAPVRCSGKLGSRTLTGQN